MTHGADVVISIDSRDDGALIAVVRALDADRRLQVKKALLDVSIWKERDGIVRMRVRDAERGAVCYMQGNEALLALGDALGLTQT